MAFLPCVKPRKPTNPWGKDSRTLTMVGTRLNIDNEHKL
jgi:hypothetical protein